MAGQDDKRSRPDGARARPRGVTMETVGRLAGVSQVTVSRALSEPGKVSPETLKRIREAIRVTGFVPNALAGALASNRSRLISALVPSITNIVYASMVQAFSDVMRENGYQILLSETGFEPEDEETLIAMHLSRRPDAMLLTGIQHTGQARKMLLGAAIPVVEVWDITQSPIDICVGFSHAEAGRAAADYLYGLGYRRAGTVSAGDERALRRKTAFAERFRQLGGDEVAEVNYEANATLARGREGLARLIDRHGFRHGVVQCSSDLLAHGVLIEARARGLKVPGEVAVLGFGDQEFAASTDPPLSTIRMDRAAFGRTAAESLLARIEGTAPAQQVFDLGFQIMGRGTTAKT